MDILVVYSQHTVVIILQYAMHFGTGSTLAEQLVALLQAIEKLEAIQDATSQVSSLRSEHAEASCSMKQQAQHLTAAREQATQASHRVSDLQAAINTPRAQERMNDADILQRDLQVRMPCSVLVPWLSHPALQSKLVLCKRDLLACIWIST